MSSATPAAPPAGGEPLVTRIGWTYRACKWTSWAVLKAFCRLRVEGLEHLPATGGALIVSNHQSFLDIPAIAAAVSRHVTYVARDTLARSRVLAFIMQHCGTVLVRRGVADRRALRTIVRHLELGDCVSIFPEGTRSVDGTLGDFRAGALLVARQAGVPIVPLAIRGAIDAWPRERRVPRPAPIVLRFAEPIDPRGPDAFQRAHTVVAALVGDGRVRERATTNTSPSGAPAATGPRPPGEADRS